MAAALTAADLDIAIIDSRDDNKVTWILVNDCAVKVKKADLDKNPDKVVNQVNKTCGLDLDEL